MAPGQWEPAVAVPASEELEPGVVAELAMEMVVVDQAPASLGRAEALPSRSWSS
jgi:hypothetical protein